MTPPVAFIRIDRVPTGEAPLWVREAWIGLHLPIYGPPQETITLSVGVLSGPKTWLGDVVALIMGRTGRTTGYRVAAWKAVALLNEIRPDAAIWWEQNAAAMIQPSRVFIFDSPCCTLVMEPVALPHK